MNGKSIAASVAALTFSTVGVVAPAQAAPPPHAGHAVRVTSDGMSVSLSQSRLATGKNSFDVSSSNPDSALILFSLKPGVTMDQFIGDMLDEFQNDPAAGTRELVRDVNFYGLADPHGATVRVTENLSAGQYYVTDLAPAFSGGMPSFTPLTVAKDGAHTNAPMPRDTAVVTGTSQDTFEVHGHIQARGSFTFDNDSDTLHFVAMDQVVPGTTDEQIQQWFDSPSGDEAPPFAVAAGGTMSTEVVSPGGSLTISTNLPPGTYVLLCFVADDETGMPHAVMGMHKVVTVR